jgi:hypothetical protein
VFRPCDDKEGEEEEGEEESLHYLLIQDLCHRVESLSLIGS